MSTDVLARRVSILLMSGCVILLVLTLAGVGRAAADRASATGYVEGERVDLPAEWFAGGRDTLLVFLRSDCAASQSLVASWPEINQTVPRDVRVLAVVSTLETGAVFAEAAGFERASVRTADFSSLRLRVVPSLVLVDAAGTVKAARVGAGAGLDDMSSAGWAAGS